MIHTVKQRKYRVCHKTELCINRYIKTVYQYCIAFFLLETWRQFTSGVVHGLSALVQEASIRLNYAIVATGSLPQPDYVELCHSIGNMDKQQSAACQ